mgnify:CR=1 FL=1
MGATNEELEKAWNQIWILEEELEKAKELAAIMANSGQSTSPKTEPLEPVNLQKKVPKEEAEPVASTPLVKNCEREKELQTIKDELAAQEGISNAKGRIGC